MNIPTLEAIQSLDGRIFATLNEQELLALEFYRAQGRKYDVAVNIINKADPADLARAQSQTQADAIMKRANSLVSLIVGPVATGAWAERSGSTSS